MRALGQEVDWAQSLLIVKDGGRICADSPTEEDPVSAIGGGVGVVVAHWWRCSCWVGVLCGACCLLSGLLWSSEILKINFATGICVYVHGLHIEWKGISCGFFFFRKSVKLYLSQQAGYPLPPLSLCPAPGLSGSDKNDIILYQAVS